MKAKISFAVRPSTAPGESAETLVPVIVDRKPPVSLTQVVENAIDRGLIVGPKTSAAEEIARGIADQIYKEFCDGHSVAFGQFFYGRPYLDGTCGPNGNLTKAANKVNARLYKGEEFRLTLDDFSFEFEGADDAPKIEWLLPTGSSGAPTRNTLEEGKPVTVLGKFLKLDGDTVRVEFKDVDSGVTVDVTTFTAAGPEVLTFAWPASLDASKSYAVTVYRTQEDGTVRTSNVKRVTIKANAPEPAVVTLASMVTEGMMDNNIHSGSEPITLKGENLTLGEGDKLYMKLTDDLDERYVEVPSAYVKRNTSAAIDLGDDVNDPIWAWIGENCQPTDEHDRITVKLVSHGGVPSSEPQTVTATAVVQFA